MNTRKRVLYVAGILAVLGCGAGVLALSAARSARVRDDERERVAAVKAGPRIQTVAVARGGGERALVVQVLLGSVPMDERAQDRRDAMQERHAPSSTLVTANETRFHRSRRCSSCRRPEAVRR